MSAREFIQIFVVGLSFLILTNSVAAPLKWHEDPREFHQKMAIEVEKVFEEVAQQLPQENRTFFKRWARYFYAKYRPPAYMASGLLEYVKSKGGPEIFLIWTVVGGAVNAAGAALTLLQTSVAVAIGGALVVAPSGLVAAMAYLAIKRIRMRSRIRRLYGIQSMKVIDEAEKRWLGYYFEDFLFKFEVKYEGKNHEIRVVDSHIFERGPGQGPVVKIAELKEAVMKGVDAGEIGVEWVSQLRGTFARDPWRLAAAYVRLVIHSPTALNYLLTQQNLKLEVVGLPIKGQVELIRKMDHLALMRAEVLDQAQKFETQFKQLQNLLKFYEHFDLTSHPVGQAQGMNVIDQLRADLKLMKKLFHIEKMAVEQRIQVHRVRTMINYSRLGVVLNTPVAALEVKSNRFSEITSDFKPLLELEAAARNGESLNPKEFADRTLRWMQNWMGGTHIPKKTLPASCRLRMTGS